MKEKWQKLMTFLGVKKVETSPDGVFMAEADVDKLAAIHEQNEKLTADLKTAGEEKTKAEEKATKAEKDNEKLQADIKTLQDENADLKTKIAGKAAEPTETKRTGTEGGNENNADWDVINSLPHNQDADKLLK